MMMPVESDRSEDVQGRLLDRLADEGRLLASAYGRGRPEAEVPGLTWSASEVVAHTGAVHRWAADIVTRSLRTNETGGSHAFAWPGPDGSRPVAEERVDELTAWFQEGLDHLVATLRAADDALDCFTFVAGVAPREFWIRRQAHETAIHRVDVEGSTGGTITAFEPWFAQDGLGEIVGAFAREPHFAVQRRCRLLLNATDGPSWRVDFDGAGNSVTTGPLDGDDADAVVRGSSDHLYRWAWNRPVDELEMSGDPAVLRAWRDTVRIQ